MLFRAKLLFIVKTPVRTLINVPHQATSSEENVNFFRTIYGLSRKETTRLLDENPAIYQTNKDDLEDSYKLLSQTMKLNMKNLAKYPAILKLNVNILENRHQIFDECGISNITLDIMSKYIYLLNRSIKLLKLYGIVESQFDVGENLVKVLKCEDILDPKCDNEIPLMKNRERLLANFFQHKLQLSSAELLPFEKSHILKIRHKSFITIRRCLELLVNEFNFSHKMIQEHPFLLLADPNNIEKLLYEVKSIFGHDVREIAAKRPIFLMTNWKSILEIIALLEKSNLSSSSLHYVLALFALEPETVSQRLEELKSVAELSVLREHPQILRLIYYQNKAMYRLGYLKQLKIKCPSINVLSGQSELFEKFIRSATDGSKNRQIIIILSKLLNFPEDDLRAALSKQTNWCDVPLLALKNTFEFLISAGFNKKHMRENVFIVFYPSSKIAAKLKEIQCSETISNIVEPKKLSKSKILNLCLYLIERDYHFTGDGVWTESTPEQS